MDYIIRTLQSHHLGHRECTEHFLDQENCKEIGLENYECTLSARVSIWVSTLSMSLQCICSVPAQYTTPCPQWEHPLANVVFHIRPIVIPLNFFESGLLSRMAGGDVGVDGMEDNFPVHWRDIDFVIISPTLVFVDGPSVSEFSFFG